ncbi:MAG: hypothetical protein CNLJKLNK_00529 [Holosporales bacterium]
MLYKKSKLLYLFIFSLAYGTQQQSLHTSYIKGISLDAQAMHGESRHVFLENFIKQDYKRDLVTHFVKACPKIRRLSDFLGKSPSTIWKLKNPEHYGALQPTAQILWQWLQSKGINELKANLDLNDIDIEKMEISIEAESSSECGLSSCSTASTNDVLLDDILQHTIDALASIAAEHQESNVHIAIPMDGKKLINDIDLIHIRNRFKVFLGNALSFFPETEASQIQHYIKKLETKFQDDQEEEFGVSAYEILQLTVITNDEYLVNPLLFNITGGFTEIMTTTPDKAFITSLNIYIIQDFRTVITFINEMESIATNDQLPRLEKIKTQLFNFYEKWSDSNVVRYFSKIDEKSLEIAQEFMRTIRSMIESIKK